MVACTKLPTTEGTIPFVFQGETYQTFYKVFGELGKGTHPPLVVLHVGPGLSHDYLLPITDLVDANIPVIFYDQVGNARSTHLQDKPPTFWTFDLFIDELENILQHLGIHDNFHLLGHSWGGILACEFEVRRQPAGLRKLVLTNSLAEFGLWMQSNMQLLQSFPKEVMEGIMGGMADPKAYRAALRVFHAKYGCTLDPLPEEYEYSLGQAFEDDTVASASPL